MLNEEELKDAALLVFANKQDQPGAKGAGEISEALRLGELRDRNWSIMACSAVDGSGVNEGMDWLVVSRQTSDGLGRCRGAAGSPLTHDGCSKLYRRSREPVSCPRSRTSFGSNLVQHEKKTDLIMSSSHLRRIGRLPAHKDSGRIQKGKGRISRRPWAGYPGPAGREMGREALRG